MSETVCVVIERNSGGAMVHGVYASRDLAEAAHPTIGWTLQNVAPQQTVWVKDGTARIFEVCPVVSELPHAEEGDTP